MVKKNYDNTLSRFIQYRNVTDGQPDRQRDRRSDGQTNIIADRDKYHPISIKFCTQQHILNWLFVLGGQM